MLLKGRILERPYLLELFVFTNLAFLALDIYVAHMVNNFAHKAEWIPLIFSLVAPLFLIPSLTSVEPRATHTRWPGFIVGAGSIFVGLLGFYYHLESQFFSTQTIKSLVYTAPFVAPLAYTGLGFLLLLNRMVVTVSHEWGRWVVILALGGFIGNFLLSVCDHAQNGFFHLAEWVPVVSSSFGVSFLLVLSFKQGNRRYLQWCLAVMMLQVVVGIIGFCYHFSANMQGPSQMRDNFIYGAPAFAPLLFVNLSLLAALGIWALMASDDAEKQAA